MEYASTYEDRIALIRKIDQRKKKLSKVKAKTRSIRTSVTRKSREENSNDNINHYTDASRYANEYYGSVMHETTRFDNEWD